MILNLIYLILFGALIFPIITTIVWIFENKKSCLRFKTALIAIIIVIFCLKILEYFDFAPLDPIFINIFAYAGGLMLCVGNRISMVAVPCVISGALLNTIVVRFNAMKMPVLNGLADIHHIPMTESTSLNWLADWITVRIGESVSVWSPGDFFIVFGAYMAGFEILFFALKRPSK